MFRLFSRFVRKKKKVIHLFLTSVVFFVCLNVSVRNFADNNLELAAETEAEPSSAGSKEPYIYLDELASKYKPPPPPPEDLPGYREPCSTVNAEASHAIKRAKTNQCKQTIADAACKLSHNKAIPVTVHNTCKRFENATFTKIRHFGCFRDDRNNRVLSLATKWFTEDNSVERCLEFCRDGMGAAYAGVEYGTECHCGYKINPAQELDFRQCNVACPGDHLQNCGGDLAINVFSTGAAEIEDAKTPTDVTTPAVLAFHLGVNGRKLRQVKQLLQAIYSPKHYYLIHVDLRQDYLHGELQKLEEIFPNVRLQRQRIKGIWGAPSLYQILRLGMRELLDWAPDWDFFINLSESCFPVQKLEVIEKFYGANQGRNFFWSYANFPENRLKQNRLLEHFIECDDYVFDIGERKWPKNLRVDSGADWYTMHRKFVEFVSDRSNPLIPQLEKIQNHSFVPTENFFHMALQNSHFCSTRVNKNQRILSWGDFPDGQCNHYEFGDYGGCSPKSLRYEDLNRLTNIKGYENFFARKFDSTVSQSVITAVDENVFGDYPSGTPALESFWECIYHHKYDSNPSMVQFSKYLFAYLIKTKKLDFLPKGTLVSGLDEINTYFDDDRYQGTLMKYQLKNPQGFLEVDLVPKRKMIRPDMRRLEQGRLKFLRIGPDYNKKERMFKNPLLYIDSKVKVITIEHMWEISEKTENVTFYWIGPSNNIYNMSVVEIKAKQEMTFLIFDMKKELQPGVWSLLIETFGNLVGYVDFPVFPARPDTPMNNPTSVINGLATVSGEINEFLSQREWPELYTTEDMAQFLFKRFYRVNSLCFQSGEDVKTEKSVIPNCQSTKWSSLSPDPKSEFKRLNY